MSILPRYENHEYANLFPMMSEAEYAALIEDMRVNGYDKTAPIIFYDNKILDGRNRYKAACELGIPFAREEYDGDDALAFVIRHNLNRRHLSETQRATVAARLANMTEGRPSKNSANLQSLDAPKVSQAAAAEMLNVSPRTVATVKAVEKAAPELIEFMERDDLSVNRAAVISRLQDDERAEIVREIREGNKPHVAYNTGQNEWYTPEIYIEAARRVMGGIDLDPASSDKANKIVKAKKFYSIDNSGLDYKWKGSVWMNPPYSKDLIGHFCNKLATHYSDGDIEQAIVMVNNATETEWFCVLTELATAVVFIRGRVKFLLNGESAGAPLQGQAVLYFGDDVNKFFQEFGGFGWSATL